MIVRGYRLLVTLSLSKPEQYFTSPFSTSTGSATRSGGLGILNVGKGESQIPGPNPLLLFIVIFYRVLSNWPNGSSAIRPLLKFKLFILQSSIKWPARQRNGDMRLKRKDESCFLTLNQKSKINHRQSNIELTRASMNSVTRSGY
ncbi:MAG TPA: hypothetical protein DCS15_04310 [Flavobacteriales bacterium]|nr:hypothetical protein [Flavobacteriales bacterium]